MVNHMEIPCVTFTPVTAAVGWDLPVSSITVNDISMWSDQVNPSNMVLGPSAR